MGPPGPVRGTLAEVWRHVLLSGFPDSGRSFEAWNEHRVDGPRPTGARLAPLSPVLGRARLRKGGSIGAEQGGLVLRVDVLVVSRCLPSATANSGPRPGEPSTRQRR